MVLAYMGLRTLYDAFRIRLGGESELEVVAPGVAYRTALLATASNPLTILTWAAVFSGAAVSDLAGEPWHAAAFVAGTALGSLASHLVLAGAMSAIGARLGETSLRVIDVVSGDRPDRVRRRPRRADGAEHDVVLSRRRQAVGVRDSSTPIGWLRHPRAT